MARWSGDPDAADQLIVSRCEAPVLDLGSGPERLVQALTVSGQPALGVDISAAAVDLSLRRIAPALRARIVDPLARRRAVGTVLPIDGNIGIGSDAHSLLTRCRGLVVPGGLIICEVDAADNAHAHAHLVLRSGQTRSTAMAWSRIGATALTSLATALTVNLG